MLNMNNIIIITGVAGFIGYSLADKLLNKRYSIIGIDAMMYLIHIYEKKRRVGK